MAKKLIAANWKENPRTEIQALALFKAVAKAGNTQKVTLVICPPFIYMEELARQFHKTKSRAGIALGAQDVFWEEKGPFTSEVGPRMLRSMGAQYVIIGHSERRKFLKETDSMINKKIKLALKDGLQVILCVGESIAIRKKGIAAAEKFVSGQLKKDLSGISLKGKRDLLIAYEPLWAIGTGRFDTPDDANDMASFIKSKVGRTTRVLYGGSVNSKNVADYVQYNSIDGALVGGASLKAGEFKKLINNI